jgi:hypothetical protein
VRVRVRILSDIDVRSLKDLLDTRCRKMLESHDQHITTVC